MKTKPKHYFVVQKLASHFPTVQQITALLQKTVSCATECSFAKMLLEYFQDTSNTVHPYKHHSHAPLGTMHPVYMTGIPLLSRERFCAFNQQIYFIIFFFLRLAEQSQFIALQNVVYFCTLPFFGS